MLAAENLPVAESTFDVPMDSENLKPVPEVDNRSSLKSFGIKLGLLVVILVSAFALLVYLKSTPPTKPTSLATFQVNEQGTKKQEQATPNKTSSPEDEDQKKSRKDSDNEPKTDSGGDGKEPPNNSQWETIHRRNVNSEIGPIVKEEETEAESVVDTKQPTSEQETDDDDREDYEMIRGPDIKGTDPRASEIGSSKP